MVPRNMPLRTLDPVEMLNERLERAWGKICEVYDASGNLPDLPVLFEVVDLSRPGRAAEAVLVNMLLEVMENICRFSPWYTKPPRSFGLISFRDATANRTRWKLAPEAAQKWEALLEPIAEAVQKCSSLIQAILLVDGLMTRSTPDDPTVTACCSCLPPRAIQIKRSVLIKAEILCDLCKQPYLY